MASPFRISISGYELIWFYFPFQKFDITIRFWYLHLRQMSWSEFAKFCLFVCFESWKFNVNLKIHFKHGPWELNSQFKMYPPENSSSFNQKKQISTFTTKRSKTLVGTFKTTVELVREFYFSKIICLVKTSDTSLPMKSLFLGSRKNAPVHCTVEACLLHCMMWWWFVFRLVEKRCCQKSHHFSMIKKERRAG